MMILFFSVASAQEEYEEQEAPSAGGRFLSSLHSLGKGFTEAAEGVEVNYDVEYAMSRVKEKPLLGLFPLAMLIAGLALNFSGGMTIASSLASFVVLIYFPTFTPAVGAFFIFAAVYHFVLRPDR